MLVAGLGDPAVEVQPRLVGRPRAGRLDPRPGDREPVGVEAHPRQQRDVLGVAVVVVVGHVPGGAVGDGSGGADEGVPDAGAPAVLVDGALDLVRRGGRPPDEVGGQGGGSGGHGLVSSCVVGRLGQRRLRSPEAGPPGSGTLEVQPVVADASRSCSGAGFRALIDRANL
ncbi:MAG: hypothetical protein AVDCRST_MAG61-2583 [uncultured Friedmanniella sp.]|uniref:Uncharacterized protein n=1 Tax=uncultured Friedmanniella sp. TaxID=335381 RepID=A0A6J4L8N0_9ACTN|nr:MAG: hypothetical protein AVDCRST_MAG61-2583 [uncultured Friedmanniella sp.]